MTMHHFGLQYVCMLSYITSLHCVTLKDTKLDLAEDITRTSGNMTVTYKFYSEDINDESGYLRLNKTRDIGNRSLIYRKIIRARSLKLPSKGRYFGNVCEQLLNHTSQGLREMDNKTNACCKAHAKKLTLNIFGHIGRNCRDDIKFAICLKDAKSVAANTTGQFYFNHLKPACFEMKDDKDCRKMFCLPRLNIASKIITNF